MQIAQERSNPLRFEAVADSIRKVEGVERARVAAFIKAQFRRHFDAAVTDDTDEVYAVYGTDGELDAAFGLNHDANCFFSRYYVEDFEQKLQQIGSTAGSGRLRVVEFAHLCVRNPRTLCRLIPVLAEFLAQRANYLICTATRELGRYFLRRGLAHEQLSSARVNALPEELRAGWGTYYQHDPMVISGCLQQACARLGLTESAPCFAAEGLRHVG